MSLETLYREVILDHYRNPRHEGTLTDPDAHAEGDNPLCGDEISLDLAIGDATIIDAAVLGRGCSISQASASMMADAIIGKSIEEVHELTHRVKTLLDIEEGDPGIDPERPGAAFGDLEALQGVKQFPVRIKCADLPWATLTEALNGQERATESD